MGWRWRRLFNLGGGVRMSTSTSGVGWSWGVGGFRIGTSPNGRKWISFGFPGTGLYFFRYLGRSHSDEHHDKLPEGNPIKKWKNIK